MPIDSDREGRFYRPGAGATLRGCAGQDPEARGRGERAALARLVGDDKNLLVLVGYQAVGTVTPMAKALIAAAYGRGPDRSYIGGTSNGGRHTMVAAARYAADYDGFLAISPGFNLPKAAVAQLYGAQRWASVATDVNNLETALPQTERRVVANAVLAKCDALDGLVVNLPESQH